MVKDVKSSQAQLELSTRHTVIQVMQELTPKIIKEVKGSAATPTQSAATSEAETNVVAKAKARKLKSPQTLAAKPAIKRTTNPSSPGTAELQGANGTPVVEAVS